MNNITIYEYNQYSNRQAKGFEGLTGYAPYLISSHANVDFNPNDGVSASVFLNCNGRGDYLIVSTIAGDIVSRWFIMESTRNRGGQYQFTLRRDVVYDHFDMITSATAYIKKGYCNLNNSAIYANEDLQLSQVKQSEFLLKDITATPWIIGYLGNVDTEGSEVEWDNISDALTVTETQFNKLNDTTHQFIESVEPTKISLPQVGTLNLTSRAVVNFNKTGTLPVSTVPDTVGRPEAWRTRIYGLMSYVKESDCLALAQDLVDLYDNDFEVTLHDELFGVRDHYSDFRQFADRVIYYSGHYYRVTMQSNFDLDQSYDLNEQSLTRDTLFDALVANDKVVVKPTIISNVPVNVTYNVRYYTCVLSEVVDKYEVDIPEWESRPHLNRQPYSMFAMPYNDFKAKLDSNPGFGQMQGAAAIAIAQGISEKYSESGALYDLQLVPYCPFLNAIDTYYTDYGDVPYIRLNRLPGGSAAYTPIYHTVEGVSTGVGYVIWCTDDTFTFNIPYIYNNPTDPIDFKVTNQSTFYRLCSPNYSGAFDFTPTKNGGIRYFNVDCTYKPFSPYIHVNPNFGGLYGEDFNDARGLICGGDFSLPQINDDWATYQIQNKNYANSFNREIESIEFINKKQRTADIITASVGTFQGAATGAWAGSNLGPGGAPIGAAVGAAASAIGGAADVAINEATRREQLDLKKDQFNYSLQNIQALPQTLAKVSAFNINNKLWPFIEIYDCTPSERNALRNKIIWNGMTINQIGYIFAYMHAGSFIQAQIIRMDIHDDWHMLNTIKEEMEVGVYV